MPETVGSILREEIEKLDDHEKHRVGKGGVYSEVPKRLNLPQFKELTSLPEGEEVRYEDLDKIPVRDEKVEELRTMIKGTIGEISRMGIRRAFRG